MPVILVLIQIYSYIVLARVILSWLPNVSRNNPLVDLIYRATEPALEPIRRALPAAGTMDFSPLILLVGLHLLRVILLNLAAGR